VPQEATEQDGGNTPAKADFSIKGNHRDAGAISQGEFWVAGDIDQPRPQTELDEQGLGLIAEVATGARVEDHVAGQDLEL